ncbi:MAG: hypothetical protein LBJ11_07745 [Oscillospiraceae bacterium]|jgi:hypothetical protein|nr:hypothetical protein [Oscillospiraceae bacterium]
MDGLSLEDLGMWYREEAETLGEMMGACQQRRLRALSAGQSKEALRQERLLELHRNQRNDLRRISAELRHYYDKTGGPGYAVH